MLFLNVLSGVIFLLSFWMVYLIHQSNFWWMTAYEPHWFCAGVLGGAVFPGALWGWEESSFTIGFIVGLVLLTALLLSFWGEDLRLKRAIASSYGMYEQASSQDRANGKDH